MPYAHDHSDVRTRLYQSFIPSAFFQSFFHFFCFFLAIRASFKRAMAASAKTSNHNVVCENILFLRCCFASIIVDRNIAM